MGDDLGAGADIEIRLMLNILRTETNSCYLKHESDFSNALLNNSQECWEVQGARLRQWAEVNGLHNQSHSQNHPTELVWWGY